MTARFIFLLCYHIARVGQVGPVWLTTPDSDEESAPWSLTNLVAGIPVAEKSLLHFGYLCMVLGLCLFMGLFAFVQGVYFRDATYRYWAYYLWSNFLLFFAALDFNFRLNLIDPLRRPWTSVAQYSVQIMYLLFLGSFLNIGQQHRPTHRLIRWLIWILTAGMVFAWFAVQIGPRHLANLADAFTFVTYLLILLLFIRFTRLGIPQTRLLIIGSMGALLSAVTAAVIDQLNLTHIGTLWLDPVVCFSVGVLFELVFFSLALSQRTHQVQAENQRLQRDYTRQLEQDLSVRVGIIQEQSRLIEDERLQRLTNDFNQKIAETEMAALRAQMNPHFIFNCLNSIQFFTAQNEIEQASGYLSKFSRLIRLVLENSRSEKVTLHNELETLRLFMDMETMRFGQKLQYSIAVDTSIDADDIQIPPLLLQPFVENAIWHGLMHKEEGGTVRVAVQQPQPDRLRIEITDNGIGRAKAAEYKSKSATKNKSFGMKVTAERIELINQLYHTQTRADVQDLTDRQGHSTGTRVIIEIPI